MDRRVFLKGASAAVATATGAFPTPAISEGIAARTLRLVPHADLANFDPIWTTAYIAHNGALLVYDMLYDIDSDLQPQRQMVDSEEVSADGLVWTFRLRPDLKFHDGEPVLATDAVASIRRWAAREPMGQMIKAVENELAANGCRVPARCSRSFRFTSRAGVRFMARGRQAHACRSCRVGGHSRPGHRRSGAAERRGRLVHHAWRKNVTGVERGPASFFWNVAKAA
jgi:hypothetical protein